MRVVNEKILVKIIKESNNVKTASGLVVPNTGMYEGLEKAKVIAIDKVTDKEPPVKVGEECLIYLGCGKEFTNPSDGEKYRVISLNEIIVVLD